MVVFNAANAVATPFLFSMMRRYAPNLTHTSVGIICVVSVLNVAFAIALLRWRRWGFYGFLGTTLVAFAVNLRIGLSLGHVANGLIGIVILVVLLNLGGENKAWRQLK
jgi:hypothetical protein